MKSVSESPGEHSSSTRTLARGLRPLFLAVAAGTAMAAPWMLGGAPLRAQWWLLFGAIATFVVGALLRLCSVPSPGARAAWSVQRWALLLGLVFLGFIFAQALNPSHRVVMTGNLWKLVPVGAESFGPTSIAAPFDTLPSDFIPFKNAWRYLLIFGICWSFAAGMALGLIERADARRWALAVGANAAILAVVCLVHRATGERLTLWHYSDTVGFTSSPVFFYKNHNGAFLAASLALVLGLAASAGGRRERLGWEVVGVVLWAATVSVNSRAATAIATLWMIVYGVMRWRVAVGESAAGRGGNKRVLTVAVVVAAVLGLVILTGGRRALGRFATALSSPLDFVQGGEYRSLLRKVGLTMWLDQPVWGWGGGSYLYLFNTYQSRVPEIAAHIYREQPNLNRFYMVSADSDWVEFLVEYGAVGVAMLIGAMAAQLGAWVGWRGWTNGLSLFLGGGAAGIVLHGYLDHVLRNPALLILLAGLLIAAVRLAAPREVKRRRSDRKTDPKKAADVPV